MYDIRIYISGSPPHPRMEKEPSSLFTFEYETNTNLCFTVYHCISTHMYVVFLELFLSTQYFTVFMTTFLDEASPGYRIPAQLSVWESWETCSTTCGVGQRNRERTAGPPFCGGGKVVKSWCFKKGPHGIVAWTLMIRKQKGISIYIMIKP